MKSYKSNSVSPIADDDVDYTDRCNVNGIHRISSTPVNRPPRESLARIKRNTVSGMVNRFTQMIECTSERTVARQVSLFTDFSTIKESSEMVADSNNNSYADSGYDSFRGRSRSVANVVTSVNDLSKTTLAKYEKFPNFKFCYLKYFGVDSKGYLSRFDIDYDVVSNSTCKDSIDQKADGVATIRKRSQTLSFDRQLDSNLMKVSNLKYLAMESGQRDGVKSEPIKVVTSVECTHFEDVFATNVSARRENVLQESLRSLGTQVPKTAPGKNLLKKFCRSTGTQMPELSSGFDVLKSSRSIGTQAPEAASVDSNVVAVHGQPSFKTAVDGDLTSRIRKSIESYDNILKAARNDGFRKRKSNGSQAE